MSIQCAIKALEEVEIFAVLTSWAGEETPRFVYISTEVARLSWEPDAVDRYLGRRAKGLIDDFIEGGHITVGWKPHEKGPCIMARVDSPDPYEIWDIRCLDPKPGARVLGGFAERDVFLAITWDYRDNFEGHWPQQIERCIAEWKRLFGDCLPFKGSKLNEYLSEPCEIV